MENFWWAMLVFVLYVPLLFLWGFTLYDNFARRDHGWVSKCLWALGVLFFPIIGSLIYFIVRPKGLDTLPGSQAQWDSYLPGPVSYDTGTTPAAGATPPQPSPQTAMRDIDTLSRLRASGSLSDEEYERLKQQVLAA